MSLYPSGETRIDAACLHSRPHSTNVIGLVYSPNGSSILSCDDEGSLCLSDANDHYRVTRSISHAVRMVDKELSPISPSPDGRHFVYVGPTEFLITIIDMSSFQETLRIEMTSCGRMVDDQASSESARFARFAPNRHVFVATSQFNLMRFDSYTGKLLSVVRSPCRRTVRF